MKRIEALLVAHFLTFLTFFAKRWGGGGAKAPAPR